MHPLMRGGHSLLMDRVKKAQVLNSFFASQAKPPPSLPLFWEEEEPEVKSEIVREGGCI